MHANNINMYHHLINTIRKLESRKSEQRKITRNWGYQEKKNSSIKPKS